MQDKNENSYKTLRSQMVKNQIEARGIKDQRVLDAMRKVPRHVFVPDAYVESSYSDTPLSIGYEQTISQPYIVAFMTESLMLQPRDRVLEIGTGSGYQTAVLAELADSVFSIELIPHLADAAEKVLRKCKYRNITVKRGDGYRGWPEKAPFDKIIVTAAPPEIPEMLIKQLSDNGIMILPVGVYSQSLILIRKKQDRIVKEKLIPVRFVPMVKLKK